jgi:DNA-binding IclR family transcriptional regulator
MSDQAKELSTRSLRALIVLEEVVAHSTPVTAFTIGRSVDLPKQTLHRILTTLTSAGFLQKEVDSVSYTPGPRLKRFSVGILSSGTGREVRMAILNRLARDLGETCNLAIPGDEGMIYLERVETQWPLRVELPIGSTVPFHCTASGKLYLSSLSPAKVKRMVRSLHLAQNTTNTKIDPQALLDDIKRIRAQGFAEDQEEFIQGMMAVAVPVLNPDGKMMSSLAVHGPSARLTIDIARGHVERLRQAAADLAAVICDDPDEFETDHEQGVEKRDERQSE